MECLRQRAGSLAGSLQRLLQRERFRQWRRQAGPADSYRWVVDHPLLVAVGVAIVVGAILAATFGVPPLSPLLLLVVVVAPVPFWLRVERRILGTWDADPEPGDRGGPSEQTGPPNDGRR